MGTGSTVITPRVPRSSGHSAARRGCCAARTAKIPTLPKACEIWAPATGVKSMPSVGRFPRMEASEKFETISAHSRGSPPPRCRLRLM
jgi:hypothetical protein